MNTEPEYLVIYYTVQAAPRSWDFIKPEPVDETTDRINE